MNTPSSSTSMRWLPAFDRLLETIRDCGTHGLLVDVRESLRPVLGPNRPLVILCPHADDGAITAACLLHEYAVRRGLPVVEVLVFAGERNVAAPWLNNQKKATVREAEFRLECNVLGAEAVFWDLEAYRMPGYLPTEDDVHKVVDWFQTRRPGAVIVPPANDAHVAHRVTRALAAIGLVGAKLSDCLVLTGWTPWGPLKQPNAYLTYDGEAERTKEWAIHCHASQVFLTDYTQYCSHLGRAYAALAREWAEGHSLAGRAHRTDDRFVGVEMFQIESYDPRSARACPPDPIQMALGILNGKLDADAPSDEDEASNLGAGAPIKTPAVVEL
jgi:LmbE family N-acetylglucosaminyl deacetylase